MQAFFFSTSCSRAWSIAGLLLSLVGVLLLFRYGMPYRTRSDGAVYLIAEETDEDDRKLDQRYTVLGWAGLILVVVGTLCQIVGSALG